jgi:hypothetical protein
MQTPHYLRFVRALAVVAGAGCSDSVVTTPDASADRTPLEDIQAKTDTSTPMDVTNVPDAALDAIIDRVVVDRTPPDVLVPDVIVPDVLAPDVMVPDVMVPVDMATADADPCPTTPPMANTACSPAGTSCNYNMAGGGFTSCTCQDMAGVQRWSCAIAVPGPLPPPEFFV